MHIGLYMFLEELALQDSKLAADACITSSMSLEEGGTKGAGVGAVGSVSGERLAWLSSWEHTSFEWGVPREGHSRRHGTMVSGSCRFGKKPKEQRGLLGRRWVLD